MVERASVRQGDIYWIELDTPAGSEPGYRRPHVVVQNDRLNRSSLRTVVVCTLTSNTERARLLGNVLLGEGEGGLPMPSVVNVTQIVTVDRSDLDEYVGTLSPRRVAQIVAGLHLILDPSDPG